MFLKKIKLKGFKSFAEKTIIEFQDMNQLLVPDSAFTPHKSDIRVNKMGVGQDGDFKNNSIYDVYSNGDTDNGAVDIDLSSIEIDKGSLLDLSKCYYDKSTYYNINT